MANLNEKSKKKIVIKNKKKFAKRICMLAAILILVVILFCTIFSKKKIDNDTNISKLNSSKYSNEIKEEYEKNNDNLEKVNLFISTQNALQTDIYNYFYSTNLEEDNLTKQRYINEKFDKKDLNGISEVDLNYWNGTWICDEYGNVKFKFANKEIEPSWIDNIRLNGYIELN